MDTANTFATWCDRHQVSLLATETSASENLIWTASVDGHSAAGATALRACRNLIETTRGTPMELPYWEIRANAHTPKK